MTDETGFFYLNLENRWPGFTLAPNLEISDDGQLTLVQKGDGDYASSSYFLSPPFTMRAATTAWRRLKVVAEPLLSGAHFQFFTLTTETDTEPNAGVNGPFSESVGWRAAPRDALDTLILNPPGRYLWVGGILRSDGPASPVLHQIRIDYGPDPNLQWLPAIFRREDSARDFLERLLALCNSILGGLEETIVDELPKLFDPLTVPLSQHPSWLAWLADWFAFELSEEWSEEETRAFLAQAFALHGRRGTVAGLRQALKWYAGVEARIVEPSLQTRLWSLGETSTLGFSTTLAPAHLQGAVLDTTATLGQSHMTRGEDWGALLFDDLAHHFCVYVYCAELIRPGALDDVRTVIEREKPAHTTYEMCVIEPRMRVGVQAQVGIDAIVASGPPPAQIGAALNKGVLVDEAVPCADDGNLLPGEQESCHD